MKFAIRIKTEDHVTEVWTMILWFVLGALFGGVFVTIMMAMLFLSKQADENAREFIACREHDMIMPQELVHG